LGKKTGSSKVASDFTVFLLAKVGRSESVCPQDITNQRAPGYGSLSREDGKHMQACTAFALCLAATGLSLPAAASVTPSGTVSGAKATAPVERIIEEGEATWYGPRFARHRTSNGETFDPSQMTAAHRSLPIGSMVRVTDEDTGRSVVVRINDREPPHGVRCIDLSEGAARALGIHGRGVADVKLTEVSGSDAVEVAEAPDDAVAPVRHARHGRRHHR
jgi:rare lipoprotein A (peptidoglycan hydrolase)